MSFPGIRLIGSPGDASPYAEIGDQVAAGEMTLKKQVPVDELRFGMYVTELDRPWTDTPFVFQGFILRTQEQLRALHDYCRHVYVDTERVGTPDEAAPVQPAAASATRVRYPQTAPLEAEFVRADYLHAKASTLLEEGLLSLQGSDILDARRLREGLALLTDSVVRNPDALLLASQMRAKSGELAQRALDVSIYMIVFGRYLQRPREEIELLGLAGLLQDVGKMKLPDQLLRKEAQLTAEELDLAKSHVLHSVEILRLSPGLPAQVAEIAALHHERLDGSGYPKGLKGREIGLHGSIAGLVDTFDALTAVRPYADQIPPSVALGLLYKERGTKFDAELVEQFIRCIGVFPVGSVVELSSGEIGLVLSQNAEQRLKPRVMVVTDAAGLRLRPYKILDLSRAPKASADEPNSIRRTLESDRLRIQPSELFLS